MEFDIKLSDKLIEEIKYKSITDEKKHLVFHFKEGNLVDADIETDPVDDTPKLKGIWPIKYTKEGLDEATMTTLTKAREFAPFLKKEQEDAEKTKKDSDERKKKMFKNWDDFADSVVKNKPLSGDTSNESEQ